MTGYRTILVAVVTMILGAVQSIEGMIPAEYAGLALQVVGGLGILLRFLTNGPVPLKGKGDEVAYRYKVGGTIPASVTLFDTTVTPEPLEPLTTPWTVTHPTGPIPSGTVTTTTSTTEVGYINPSNI